MSVEQERNIIECKNVSKTFQTPSGPFQVIGDFSLTAREHEFVALFGPGQCGKSTIINRRSGDRDQRTGNRKWKDGKGAWSRAGCGVPEHLPFPLVDHHGQR